MTLTIGADLCHGSNHIRVIPRSNTWLCSPLRRTQTNEHVAHVAWAFSVRQNQGSLVVVLQGVPSGTAGRGPWQHQTFRT